MNKAQFIEKLMRLYPEKFSDSNTCEEWIESYENVLNADFQIDYEKLFELIFKEWKYSKTPEPAWLSERLPRCKAYRNNDTSDTKTLWVKIPWIITPNCPDGLAHLFEVPIWMNENDVIFKLKRQLKIGG